MSEGRVAADTSAPNRHGVRSHGPGSRTWDGDSETPRFKVGDRVKVECAISPYDGLMGSVVENLALNRVRVDLDGRPLGLPTVFREHELMVGTSKPTADLSSQGLAEYTEKFIRQARKRIVGVGKAQYEKSGRQKFQDMPVKQIIDEAIEELSDVAVYASMLAYRLDEIKAKLDAL